MRKIFGEDTVYFLEEKNRKRNKRKISGDGKYLSCGEEKSEKEREKMFGEGKYFLWRGRKPETKRKKIFGEGKYLNYREVEIPRWERRKMLERKIYFMEEKKNGEGRGGNYLENKN